MHMQKQARTASGHPWRIVLATLFAMALVVLWRGNHLYAAELAAPAAQGAPADDGGDGSGDNNGGDPSDDIKVYGLLTISPTEGLTGTWVIGGVAYTATESTQFSTLHGDFVIDGCVEVEVAAADPTVAKEIGTEEMSNCTGQPGDDDGSGDDPSDDIKVYALLTMSPTGGMTGTWTIGSVEYTATESTQFSTLHGDFTLGGCVEVEVSPSNPTVAKEIGTEEMSKCTDTPGDDTPGDDTPGDDTPGDDANNDGDGSGNDDGDHEGDGIKVYGLLTISPTGGLTGTWVIGGISYTATEATEFENEYGGFAAGVCVKVEVSNSDPTVIKELETEEDYKCSGRTGDDDHEAEGKLYGEVTELPKDGLIGLWIIGGKSISVTEQTNLHSDGVFTVGVTVKVEFITTISNTHIAKEIELKYGHHGDDHHDGDDDGDFGDHDGREGQAYGVVESRPDGLTGVWMIGGVEYTVTERTKFDDGEELAVGDLVKVKYFVKDDGSRRAYKIDTEDGQGQLDNPNMNKIVGIVTSLPPSGFGGTWGIAGANFVADLATRFEEEDGLLVEGAYVEVLYVIEGNDRRIVKMESHVPPGAGDDDSVGEVESVDDSAATVAAVSATAIVVDGVSYSVNPATQIIDTNGDVVVGSTVAVNSYMTANGQNVATRIRSVTLDNVLVMPFAQR